MPETAVPQIGLGLTLSIGTQGGAPTYTVIAGLTKVTPPKPKWGTEDVTVLNQAAPDRQFIKTLRDLGEIAVEGFRETADPGQQALYTAFLAPSNQVGGGAYPFKIVWAINLAGGQATTGDTATFSGLVTDYADGEAEPGKPIPFTATIKVNGTPAPTFVEGA